MGYAIADLRSFARNFVRNAVDSSTYSDSNIDRALQCAMDEWCRLTQTPKTLGSLTLTAGSNALPASVANWAPEFHLKSTLLLAGTVVRPDISFTDYNAVLMQQFITGSSSTYTGAPLMYGYQSNGTASGTGICWPTPDKAYNIFQWFREQPTTWTIGGSCSSFNLPDEALRVIATDGCEAFLQYTEPQNAQLAQVALTRFNQKANQFRSRNAGGRSGQVVTKDDPDCDPYGPWVPRIPAGGY